MEDMNRSDFCEIINKISQKRIVLPDFQREFVWKSEEQQCKLVASVLARMPIGSVLLLKSKPDEYATKIIGCRNSLDVSEIQGEVEFLLDGQQRITVLSNVFSSIIHELCPKVSELNSPSLKRRFFLRIPKWTRCRDEKDLFGVQYMQFKYKSKKDPDFLSGEVYPFVECLGFKVDDQTPYNPKSNLSVDLDNFCLNYDNGYLIPLFLLAPSECGNQDQAMLRYEAIIQKISKSIYDEIINYFEGLPDDARKINFVSELVTDEVDKEEIKNNLGLFSDYMDNKKNLWRMSIDAFLKACVEDMALNRIVVSADQRARAIDIYENLNRGGVSLNTFDLIMARVAKVSTENFYQRIINNIKRDKVYELDVVPECIKKTELSQMIINKTYNASLNTNCYIESKNEIASKYIDVFLDVLSLYCHNKDTNPSLYKIDNIKRDEILAIEPEDIDKYCEKICDAIDRALFFFQVRCGIRSITEINYSLIIVLVASVFLVDSWYDDHKTHDKLEAWYWSVLFSGEYDKDQNTKMITNLQNIIRTFRKEIDLKWISSISDLILRGQNFSDKEFILMEKVADERYPKDIIRSFVCQYYLSKTYEDMFDPSKKISVFCKESDTLEAHHIIPLGTVKKIGESTSELRKNRKHICNSPMNFVLITRDSNKEISDDSLVEYAKKLCPQARAALHISKYNKAIEGEDCKEIKEILEDRFDYLLGDLQHHVNELLS
ncbi:DUF262 domain-containing protein [Eubacterium xylanophilum]|uniref:DUF262 domain-containing protein n=1 Tax=Eubacterium xylanophilum TaxID=39497 RepID=UPI00047D7AEE|nr:DUF262 domain-containing protein [Eubacterium xylanophilum]